MSLEFLFFVGVFHLKAEVLESFLGLNLLSKQIVGALELFGLSNKLLDLLLGESTLVDCDCDLLSLSCGLVACGHVQDDVGFEGDLDLMGAAGRRRDNEVELAERVVVLCNLALSFVHLDEHAWLIVGEVKVWAFFVRGMEVFLWISTVMTLPAVSIP